MAASDQPREPQGGHACPVCSRTGFGSAQDLEAHVNAHFDGPAADSGGFDDDDEVQIVEEPGPGPSAVGAPAGVPCPQCGAQLAAGELDSHLLAHQLEQEELQQLEEGATDRDAAAAAAQEAQDAAAAAALAAAEWGDDAATGGGGGSSDDDAVHAAAIEEAYFQELRAKYGFEAAPRQGACRVCQQQGHWARECPQNPDVAAAAARVLEAPTPAAIAASQQQARGTHMAGPGLVQLLAGCLEAAAPGGAAGVGYAAALCAPGVQHFPSTLFASGWGCGYQNIQQLASHLLAARPEAGQALFGGAGWVPDIPALQAWLEAAWQAGYDPEGAEQLERRVQGTQKWIGTTEAAALLRYFGLRAQVVDFGAPSVPRGMAAAAAAAGGGGGQPVHPGVECDACGQCPIRGDRFKSESRPDYDLCAACHAAPAAAAAGPFRRMLPGAVVAAGGGGGGPRGGATAESVARQLLQWVWRYFTTDEAAEQPSSNVGAAAAAAAGEADGAAPDAKRLRLQQSPVRVSRKPALYFQHEGHSRTIIGIERRLAGPDRQPQFTLLVLDPQTPGAALAAALAQRDGWQRLLKRGAHTLRHGQYQLLYVAPGLAGPGERQQLKRVAAVERF